MIIYIVTASSGQYDDYRSWNIKGFLSEDLAQKWIDTQPKISHLALQELEDLRSEYLNELYDLDTEGWGDSGWEVFDDRRYELEKKALNEIQIKYPDADLAVDIDFHGYSIESLQMEEG
jgi:hypothetical protein